MKFHKQDIEGLLLIEPSAFVDQRGVFRRHFCRDEFAKAGISPDVSQANISENRYAYTLRGFHYQLPPYGEGKTLCCLKGSIYNVTVDLRPDSVTYKKWLSYELSDKNKLSVHVPPGCANAFLTLEDNCLIHYYCSQSYNSVAERGVRYDDPSFGFLWPHKPAVISDKDLNHPDYIS
jgi:dTDP-4-dehydrorhamnose 3,5-epimerase